MIRRAIIYELSLNILTYYEYENYEIIYFYYIL